jgi:hypothetical protein
MKLENHSNYNCRVLTEDGQEYLLYANWLHNNQFNHWKDWQCNAGVTRLYIDKDLNVHSGECENDLLGTVFDFELLNSNICKRDRCTGCTDDLIVPKKK